MGSYEVSVDKFKVFIQYWFMPNELGLNGWGTTRPKSSVTERLDASTNKTETCWLWTGSRYPDGYPRIKVEGEWKRVARLVWQMRHGQIPAGLVIRHKCDVPICVNPDHLEIGTQKQNMDDRVSRGRWRGNQKFSQEMKEEFAHRGKTENVLVLAKEFGISRTQAYRIVGGKNKKRTLVE